MAKKPQGTSKDFSFRWKDRRPQQWWDRLGYKSIQLKISRNEIMVRLLDKFLGYDPEKKSFDSPDKQR
jgi:hypothetical protein